MRSYMNTTIYRYLLTAAAFATLMLAACSDIDRNGVPSTDDGPAELYVAVRLSNALTETRADGDADMEDINGYDQWSYRGFSLGDKLGFFSPHGDYNVGDGEGAFINEFLEYTYNDEGKFSYFHNDYIQFSPKFMDDPGKCFIYMPYGGSSGEAVFELRRKVDKDDILRCVDYLQTLNNLEISANAGGTSATLAGTMAHSFSELIIMRGKGFDKKHDDPEKNKITVVLTDGFSHMRIEVPTEEERAEGEWYCKPTLFYPDEGGYTAADGTSMSKEDCARWEAWQGSKFLRTDLNNIGVEAWYVILPTLTDKRSTVSYIEMYDNEEQLQRVTAIKLEHHDESGRFLGTDKQLYPGWRYPIEIQMDELVPTVNPYPIVAWNGEDGKDTNITNERKRGIASPHDFGVWLQLYNQYISGDGSRKDELLLYGDLTQYDEGNGNVRDVWHFYLLSDIDLENYEYNNIEKGALIPELRDIIDGRSTTLNDHEFENYKLKNLNTPLVDMMTATGQLLNMDFDEPDIKMAENNTSPAGILVNTMAGGTINNCNITEFSIFNPSGPVGIIAGQITGASSITDCNVSGGILWGSESAADAKYIYGKKDDSVSVSLEGTKTGGVRYSDTDPNN